MRNAANANHADPAAAGIRAAKCDTIAAKMTDSEIDHVADNAEHYRIELVDACYAEAVKRAQLGGEE